LLIEEYGAELEYIKGETNTRADALSRVPTEEIFILQQPTDDDFPLNLRKLVELQKTDKQLVSASMKPNSPFKKL
jgi:hypothetical protein